MIRSRAESVISPLPAEARRTCLTDYAVTLYLNEFGRIVAVGFILGGP